MTRDVRELLRSAAEADPPNLGGANAAMRRGAWLRRRRFLQYGLPMAVIIGVVAMQVSGSRVPLIDDARKISPAEPGLRQPKDDRVETERAPGRSRRDNSTGGSSGIAEDAGEQARRQAADDRPTSNTVESLRLSGRIAFTALDKPVDQWVNECAGGPCFFYNPSDIKTLDLRTGKTAPIAASPLFEQGSRWSPDGSRLAYSVARGDSTASLHTMKADGTGDRRIVSVEGKLALQPTWSPDGRRIAFTMQNHSSPFGVTYCREADRSCPEIWMVNADGTDLHRIDEIKNTEGSPSDPAWSPDGRHLAFATYGPWGDAEVWILDLETGRPTYFSAGTLPAWAPDGKRLAITSLDVIRVIAIATGDWVGTISQPDRWLNAPAWSPDGKWVAFTVAEAERGKRSIWVARPNGKDENVIVRGAQDYWAPTWAR